MTKFSTVGLNIDKRRTPGTELVRVRRLNDDGDPLTWAEATSIARVRFGGDPKPFLADARFFAFEVRR